jgi:hypothetical protein
VQYDIYIYIYIRVIRRLKVKIRPVGAKLLHEDGWRDGQTDMTKLIATFHNLASIP